ncbi:unnamed protein product [Rotaria sordida]|uniref:Uncharacterized protein n=1 Tax=Rotaria sordida TaxID=392033 RepID=A0A819UL15_9BILA|nr:unnamed protein product [Rotaria sordida]
MLVATICIAAVPTVGSDDHNSFLNHLRNKRTCEPTLYAITCHPCYYYYGGGCCLPACSPHPACCAGR